MEIKNTVSQIYFRINVLSILLCIILSCRTAKEKSELLRMNTKAQSVSRTNTSWMQLNRQDSTYRYWHYTGDSIFFFHPDRGLWSRSGQFTYIEQKSSDAKDEKMVFQQDSLRTFKAESQLDTYYRSESHFLKHWLWILLLGGLVLICWIVITIKKTGRI